MVVNLWIACSTLCELYKWQVFKLTVFAYVWSLIGVLNREHSESLNVKFDLYKFSI
jgi:hypothetical protein